MSRYAHLVYTPTVREVQHEMGSGEAAGRRLVDSADRVAPLGAVEVDFLNGLDGFFLASVGETGWPYVQHRGGPPGFLHVLDEHTLAFADVRGNRQYVTMGNLRSDDRVALFCLDYARQRRLKLYGHATAARVADTAPDLVERLAATRADGRVEHVTRIQVEAFEWNCPKHITPRFSELELDAALQPVRDRIARLERENDALRARLSERAET
jgi:predicted pyridoxine 5'-phosphate oxidase superfamily flavin-nucleotide-binding protein